MKFYLTFLLTVFLGHAYAADGYLPAHPRSLFAVFPGELKTWKLVESTAGNSIEDWPRSHATRVYEKPLEDQPEATYRTRITITDTARFPSALAGFAKFVPGEEVEGEGADLFVERRLFMRRCPVYISEWGENELTFLALVDERFLIEMTMEAQPKNYVKEWFARLDLDALKAIPLGEKGPYPEEYLIIDIDEIAKTANSYLRALTNVEQLETDLAAEAALETLAAEAEAAPSEDPELSDDFDQ